MTDKAKLAARFDRVLSALRAVIATETALDPAWEETKQGVGGAFGDTLFSRSQARTAFEDETPTMDALAINLKDNCYKDPSWPTDGADDAQVLRSAWHCIHDTIGASQSFGPDDLSMMRNLYTALERAREKCGEGEQHDHLVTLQQAAAMVSRAKKTLERRKADDPKFPMPRVAGGGGKPTEYAWSEMRLYLEGEFDRKLPEQFPSAQFVRH
jgi:hypothetical protein